MAWFDDVARNVGNFFGGLFGGNNDDEERKRRERQQQQNSQPKPQVQTAQPKPLDTGLFAMPNQNQNFNQPQQPVIKPVTQPPKNVDPAQVEAAAKAIADGGAGAPYTPEVIAAAKPRAEELKKAKRAGQLKDQYKQEIRSGKLNPNMATMGGTPLLFDTLNRDGYTWQERQQAIQAAQNEIRQENLKAQNDAREKLRQAQDVADKAASVDTRLGTLHQGVQQNLSREEIARRAGLSRAEVDDYLTRLGENNSYQTNAGKQVADFFGGLFNETVGAIPNRVATSLANGLDGTVKEQALNSLKQGDADYKAGKISLGRLQDIYDEWYGKDINSPYKVTENGVEDRTGVEKFTNWAGQTIDSGVNTASVLPVASGVGRGLKAGEKLTEEALKGAVKQSAKEGVVYGTADTANDVIQGRGVTPQSLIMNYGAPTVGNVVGELAGRSINNRLKQVVSKMKGGQELNAEEVAEVAKVLEDNGIKSTEDFDKVSKPAEAPAQQPVQQQKTIVDKDGNTVDTQTGEILPKTQDNEVIQVINPDGSKSFYRIPADQRDDIVAMIDNQRGGDGAIAGSPTDFGTFHVTARTPEDMAGRGFNDAGVMTKEQLQKVVDDAKAKMNAPAENAQEVIPEVQAQAAEQAQGGQRNRGFDAEEMMATLQGRRDNYRAADEGTRAAMVRDAQAEVQGEPNPYTREAVYSDLQGAGLTPEDITRLTQQYNMNAADWRTVLNRVGDLSKARNKAAVIASDIQKMRAGQTSAGQIDNAAVAARRQAPQAEATPEPRSSYEGNINEIRQQVTTMLQNVDEALQREGSSFEVLGRKIQEADRIGKAPQLTEGEQLAYQAVRSELDKALEAAGQAGRLSDDVGQREWYLPQAKKDSTQIPQSMEDLYNTGFGYQNARTNAIDLNELDYGYDPVIDYVVRGKASDQMVKQRIFDNIVTENPNVTREVAEQATEIQSKMIDDINKVTEDPRADGAKIDTTGALKAKAEAVGIQRVDDNTKLSGVNLNTADRLQSVGQYFKGFYQYRFAQALAQDITSPQELPDVLKQMGLDAIPENRVNEIVQRTEYMIDNADRYLKNADERTVAAYNQSVYANAIRSAAKGNVEETLLRTNFTDPKTNALLNKEFNDMAIGYNKATTTVSKLGEVARRVMNNSMRNLNVNSFLNEMTDVVNVLDHFGVKSIPSFSPLDMMQTVRRYGLEGATDAFDNPDKAVEAFGVFRSGNKKALDGLFKAANTIDEKTALYHVAENYKAAVYLKAAEDFYIRRGLSGNQLRNAVISNFDRDMIPLDHFSRVFATDNQAVKLLTQYLDWNILNTRRQGLNLVGSKTGGIYDDLGRGGSVARNLAMNLAPRVGLGMVRGVPIITTLGLLDPLGIASQDYSGIQEKNPIDVIVQTAGISPILSLASQFYMNYRQDEEAMKQYDGKPPEDQRGDWLTRSLENTGRMFTPFGGQIKRTGDMVDVLDKGYSENKSGRVQYLAPENPLDILRGLVMGKGQTQEGREYSGTPDIFSVLAGDAAPTDLFTSNPSVEAFRTLLGEENVGDYLRPLTDSKNANYSDAVKEATTRDAQEALLAGGRQYNEYMDNLRKNNPEAYNNYMETFETGNFVSPEFWRQIVGGNADGQIDLATFHMMSDRKKQAAKDLGVKYDPLYDLPDDRARAVLQQKSTATGDDIALRNILYKEQWYQDYMKASSEYYEDLPESTDADEFKQTERVKQWNKYNEQLSAFSTFNDPSLQAQFPYTAAYKAAEAEYEKKTGQDFYGSQESKNWFANYGQGYMNEKDDLNAAKLQVINEMRAIEGFPPMSADAYEQATNIADTDGSGGGYSGGGGGSEYDWIPEFYAGFKATDMPQGTQAKKVDFKPNTGVGRRTNTKKSLGAKSSGGDKYTV